MLESGINSSTLIANKNRLYKGMNQYFKNLLINKYSNNLLTTMNKEIKNFKNNITYSHENMKEFKI